MEEHCEFLIKDWDLDTFCFGKILIHVCSLLSALDLAAKVYMKFEKPEIAFYHFTCKQQPQI